MRNALTAAIVAMLAVLASCQSSTPAEVLRTRGDDLYAKQEYRLAALQYREVTDRYPGDWRAQYQLGRCYIETDQLLEASKALTIATTRRPANTDIADAMAETLYRSEEYDRLFAYLQDRVRQERTPEAHMRLGWYAHACGDPDTARIAYEAAILVNERRSVEPYLAASRFYEEIGRLDEAVIKARQAYSFAPDDPDVRSRLVALGEIPGPVLAIPTSSAP